MLAVLLTTALGLFVLFLVLDSRRPQKFPPGPQWVPIIGNSFLFYQIRKKLGYTHLVWDHLSKRYGDLVGVRLGNDKLVIGTGHSVVKQLLTREQFDARPDGFFFRYRAYGGRYGLVFVEGDFYNEQKRFVMKHLRSLGLNKNQLEVRINVESAELIQHFIKHSEEEVILPEALEVSVVNILWMMMAGERWSLHDPRPRKLMEDIHMSFRMTDMSGGILNQMPYLRFVLPELTSFNKLKLTLHNLISFIEGLVEDHRRSASPYESRDLIDAYINEIKKHENDPTTTFTEKQMNIMLLDLFLAGSETVSSTLGFGLLVLLNNPHIQEKIHQEMDRVVGKHKQPALEHKQSLIYFEAFVMELQRFINVSATTVAHCAKEDTEVDGYIIPKGTIVIANLHSLHMNREHWGDPEVFRPERFFNSNGELIQDDWLIPFGLGKRRCLGEVLARTSIYLFLTAILHNFEVTGAPGEPLPPIKANDGATLIPVPFKAVFKRRQ